MHLNKGQYGGAVGLLALGLLGTITCTSVAAARHHGRAAAAYHGGYEHALAGIRLGDPVTTVLHKYGNPSEVQIERIILVAGGGATSGGGGGMGPTGGKTVPMKIFIGPSSAAPTAGGGGSGGGYPGGGSGGGYPGGGLGGAVGSLSSSLGSLFQGYGGYPGGGGYPGMGGYPGAMGGGYPGAMGGGYPGGGGGYPGGGGGASGPTAGTLITPDHPETKYIYDQPFASSLEFVLSPTGHVEQIRATGYRGSYKTSRGVQLGMKYSQVVLTYGNPENQAYSGAGGDILTVDYTSRAHCSFQFYNDRLVGITVAQVD